MDQNILNIFKNPNSDQVLEFDSARNVFIDKKLNEEFFLKDNVFNLLPKTDSHYRQHYQEDAEAFDYFVDDNETHLAENERIHQKILKNIGDEKIILDVGCGKAWLANSLLNKGKSIISMDISERNPKEAKKLYPQQNHTAIIADVFHLPFKENALDAIVASEIIEHVPDPEIFIKSLLQVLKKNGKLIITTPYNEKILKTLCIHCNKLTPYNAHLHSFNREKFKQIIPNDVAGFKMETFNNKALLFTRMHKRLRFLPEKIWSVIDKTASAIFPGKELRMIVVITK